MTGNVKLLVGGLTLGLLLIFALVGLKSMFTEEPTNPLPTTTQWQQSNNSGIVGLPGTNGVSSQQYAPGTTALNNGLPSSTGLNSSQQDTTLGTTNNKAVLVGEPSDTTTDTSTTPRSNKTPTQTVTPNTATPTPTAVDNSVPTKMPTAPVALTGKLDIMAQTAESGIPLNADIYVQLTNGKNITKASGTQKVSFELKEGTYRITARAEGRASISRTISVPAKAVVSEIFALPLATAQPPTQAWNPPTDPPVAQPIQPVQPATGKGKLRLVAVDADSGTPVPVDFTISRLNGGIVNQINDVPVAEITLPAEEFVVRFNYNGLQGYKSLTVQPGQTHTHTFNIRGALNGNLPPASPENPRPMPNNSQPTPENPRPVPASPDNPQPVNPNSDTVISEPAQPNPAMGMDDLLKRMK